MEYHRILPFLFVAFLIPQVIATTQCNNIALNTQALRITPGGETRAQFIVDNPGTETFFIDSTDVNDNTYGIIASENGFTRVIEAQDYGTIGVRVQALPDAESGIYYGTVVIRGHFQGGRECTFSDIVPGTFPIIVAERNQGPSVARFTATHACEGIIITNPVGGWQTGDYTIVRIDNHTGFSTTIRLSGPGVTFNPHTILVPAGSTAVEKVAISGRPDGWMYYGIENAVCSGTEQAYIGMSGMNTSKTPASEPVEKYQSLAERIKMGVSISENAGSFAVTVTLENRSSSPIAGMLSATAPQNWEITGNNQQISLAGGEIKTAEIRVNPQQLVLGEHDITLTFRVQENITRHVTVTVQSAAPNTGPQNPFAGLFSLGFMPLFTSIPFWALVLVIAILAWLFFQGRQRVQLDQHDRTLYRP